MTTLIFDIETNGLLDVLTTIHSLVIKDADTGEVFSCTDKGPGLDYYSVAYGVAMLRDADVIVGHNIADFDIPAIQKIYPEFKPKGTIRDTLTMSRLIWANLLDADFRRADKGKWIPTQFNGRHSLEAWGLRLGVWKGDYGQIKKEEGKALGLEGDALVEYVWGTWSKEMQDYCEQDVEVTHKLYEKCQAKKFSEDSIQLEHDVQRILWRQEAYGFRFNEAKAAALLGTLTQEKLELEQKLIKAFKPWYRSEGEVTPTMDRSVSMKDYPPIGYRKHKRTGEYLLDKEGNKRPIYVKCEYSADAPYTKIKLKPFNPTSRFDIANRLITLYGWKPKAYTPDGHPKVDEDVLKGLKYPEAKLLTRYLLIDKRIGQISTGKEAWLKHVKNGRLHGRVNPMGTVTSRMTHSKPNMAQVPSSKAPFGHECRELFEAGPGKKLVGCDADALELRDLAGYMAIYDGGAYIETILKGNKDDGTDMHTLNAQALGCDRDTAKVWFYAFIYGAGDFKLGSILGAKGKKAEIVAAGTQSRAKFLRSLPALKKLVEKVKAKAAKFGRIRGLDGRILPVRAQHSALNTLLQSAGAIQMKRGLVILDDALQAEGLIPGEHYEFVGNIHDEWQIEVDEDKAELVGRTAANAIRLAGEYYSFRCPLAGNFDIGHNWSETH